MINRVTDATIATLMDALTAQAAGLAAAGGSGDERLRASAVNTLSSAGLQLDQKVAAYLALLEKQGVAPAELAEPRLARETASLFLNMATGGLRFATLLQAAEPAADHPDMPGRSASDRSAVRRAVQLLLAGFERK